MDKHKLNDGFTLMEMLLVLFIISILFLLFPLFSMKRSSVLYMQTETLRYSFLEAQSMALHEKRHIVVRCSGALCYIDETEIPLKNKMKCYGEVGFNESGNVSKATTFSCSLATLQQDLVVQLGSGRMYVK